MADVREVVASTGFANVQTVLQTGNLVFESEEPVTISIESRLQDELRRSLGLETEVFVRSAHEWREVVRRNPFPREAERDPSHLLVTLLRAAPTATAWEALRASIRGREEVRGFGRHGYFVYPDGIGDSPVTTAVVERHLGTLSTSRNWNTVSRLAELLSG